MTLSISLDKSIDLDTFDAHALYTSFYQDEPLVKVLPKDAKNVPPKVRDIVGRHHAEIGAFTLDKDKRRLALVVTIDNLLKGAASQATQNINLALGLKEMEGL